MLSSDATRSHRPCGRVTRCSFSPDLLAEYAAAHTSFSEPASDKDLLILSGVSTSDTELITGSGEVGGVTGRGCSGSSVSAHSELVPCETGFATAGSSFEPGLASP